MSDQHAELVRLKKRVRHQLLDVMMLVWGLVLAVIWQVHGHDRDAFLLLVISYWGSPWPENRYER